MTARSIAAIIVLTVSLAAGTAEGAVRAGSVTDPADQQVDDTLEPQYETDLERTAATFDDIAGTVRVAATFYQAEPSHRYLRAGFAIRTTCEGQDIPEAAMARDLSIQVSAMPSGEGGVAESYAELEGFEGTIVVPTEISEDRRTIAAEFTHPRFVGLDWRCVESRGSAGGEHDEASTFNFDGYPPLPAPPPEPQPCSRSVADQLGFSRLLSYAAGRYPDYYGGTVKRSVWHLGTTYCRDLTGDGEDELAFMMNCCTGGALSPWAIFKRDELGRWRMAYVRVRDTVFSLKIRPGRLVRATSPAPYNGFCSEWQRNRLVQWDGERFVSRRGQRFHRNYRGCR